jgi:hypothetical protein
MTINCGLKQWKAMLQKENSKEEIRGDRILQFQLSKQGTLLCHAATFSYLIK